MILTSYFAKHRSFPAEMEPVCIVCWPPRGICYPILLHLAPSSELLKGYKAGKISEREYTKIFNEQLHKLDAQQVGKELEEKILLCYEKTGDFCHRHLVADWLRQNGFSVSELK